MGHEAERHQVRSPRVQSDEPPFSKTELAEDRTLLANERTFAGWMRTSLGCIGIALAFHALFRAIEPLWLPKAAATLFLLIAVQIAWASVRRAASVRQRVDPHLADAARPMNLEVVAGAISLGAGLVAAIFWLSPAP